MYNCKCFRLIIDDAYKYVEKSQKFYLKISFTHLNFYS